VLTAVLVDLVMDLVIDPDLVVLEGVVPHRHVHILLPQLVDHLDLVELKHDSST
jgi:hypothetical protein